MIRQMSLTAVMWLAAEAALAQSEQRPAPPQQPNPRTTIPEQVDPAPVSPPAVNPDQRPGESLSDQLDRTGGVIRPPENTAPNMPVITPPPGTSQMPVIPPPGTPQNQPNVRPE